MTAILTACAVSGFWAVGHCYYVQTPSLASCERERPRVEADMRSHGQPVRFSTCREKRT